MMQANKHNNYSPLNIARTLNHITRQDTENGEHKVDFMDL